MNAAVLVPGEGTHAELVRRTDAQRAAKHRALVRRGEVSRRIVFHEVNTVTWLLDRGYLTEAQALDNDLVDVALARAIREMTAT